jgi:hypothetical protein
MKNSNQRLHFLNTYRTHLRDDLDQMGYGQVSQIAAKETPDAPDRVSGTIAIAAMVLVFASIFLIQ